MIKRRTFFVLTNENARKTFCESYPDICVSWLYNEKNDIEKDIAQLQKYKRAMLSIHSNYATQERIDALNKAGVYYQVYSVEEEEKAIEYRKMGVPMIETNWVVPMKEE